jgi:peptidoglycan-associated lipoprotein
MTRDTAAWIRFGSRMVLSVMLALAVTHCSKKDVTDGSGDAGAADMGASAAADDSASAGDAGGMQSADLRPIYFEFDSYRLTNGARKILKANAAWLKSNASVSVQIEGHCDERGTPEYNLALGERRANAAKEYLIAQGIDASRVSVISYGEERPVDPGHDEAAWAKNRRAEMVILSR